MKRKGHKLYRQKRLLVKYEHGAGTSVWYNYALSTLIRRHGKDFLFLMFTIDRVRYTDNTGFVSNREWMRR